MLEFENDEQALTFVKNVARDKCVTTYGEEALGGVSNDGSETTTKIRGVWKKPTLICDPSDGHRRGREGWTRGRKYGWWVCAGCGKVARAASDFRNKQMRIEQLGFNLLPPEISGETDPSWHPKEFININ